MRASPLWFHYATQGKPRRQGSAAEPGAISSSQRGPRNRYGELKPEFCQIVGGEISPLLSNLYLAEVDKMLERAKEVTRYERGPAVEYARFADDRAPRAQRAEEGPMCVTA
jgi:hypothetical protein